MPSPLRPGIWFLFGSALTDIATARDIDLICLEPTERRIPFEPKEVDAIERFAINMQKSIDITLDPYEGQSAGKAVFHPTAIFAGFDRRDLLDAYEQPLRLRRTPRGTWAVGLTYIGRGFLSDALPFERSALAGTLTGSLER